MDPGKPATSVLAEILVREYHHLEGHPRIFSDPYAHRLLTDPERKLVETRWLESPRDRDRGKIDPRLDKTHVVSAALRAMPLTAVMLGRARYGEEELVRFVYQGGARGRADG